MRKQLHELQLRKKRVVEQTFPRGYGLVQNEEKASEIIALVHCCLDFEHSAGIKGE